MSILWTALYIFSKNIQIHMHVIDMHVIDAGGMIVGNAHLVFVMYRELNILYHIF